CHSCAMGRTTGPLPHRKPNKKEPVGSFQRGGRREYFVAALLVPLLRNGANHGFASAPKAKQKRARRLLANRVSAGNTSRKSAHAVYREFFCARAIAAQWSEPRVGFRTESQTKKSPKA